VTVDAPPTPSAALAGLPERLAAVRGRIERAGGDPARVRVVAVTKGFGGGDGALPTWHFVGRLQRNKVRKAAPFVGLWHSVDRLSLGVEIARQAPGAAVFAQVNTTDEEQKGGCPPAMLPTLLDGLRDVGLDVRGLMTIGPAGDPEDARPAFRRLREMAGAHGLAELSMGMSSDLEVAVEEGATMVRVGGALFGPRPDRPGMRH
jgi:PLP dependent protein